MSYKNILTSFGFADNLSVEPFGSGHIHKTYLIDGKYILQELNNKIFKNIEELMKNMFLVTDYLDSKGINTIKVINTTAGKSFYLDENNKYWRVYKFFPNSVTYEAPKNETMFKNTGYAFGKFISDLKGFPVDKLYDTLPGYHITANYWQAFNEAIKNGDPKRANETTEQIKFFQNYADFVAEVPKIKAEMPKRVVHQDTKINNILFDEVTDEPLCVIDLDTVGVNTAVFDFGDTIRFSANEAAEDEEDLSKVKFNAHLYDVYKQGFVEGLNPTESELNYLFWGAKLMTFENGMRFLTDYLMGDVYFNISKPKHNLIRSKNQIKLFTEMEKYENL